MKTIWKYNLDPRRRQGPHLMPQEAEIVAVSADPANPDLVAVYAKVTPEDATKEVQLYLTGTGHPAGENDKYLGTAVCPPFAWHVWMELP